MPSQVSHCKLLPPLLISSHTKVSQIKDRVESSHLDSIYTPVHLYSPLLSCHYILRKEKFFLLKSKLQDSNFFYQLAAFSLYNYLYNFNSFVALCFIMAAHGQRRRTSSSSSSSPPPPLPSSRQTSSIQRKEVQSATLHNRIVSYSSNNGQRSSPFSPSSFSSSRQAPFITFGQVPSQVTQGVPFTFNVHASVTENTNPRRGNLLPMRVVAVPRQGRRHSGRGIQVYCKKRSDSRDYEF